MLALHPIKNSNWRLTELMERHYSKPEGFVGRNICYSIWFNQCCYGAIVGGSAPTHLPNRNEFFAPDFDLQRVIDNIFFHVEPTSSGYPVRNFTSKIIERFEEQVADDWLRYYRVTPIGYETLVELPRTGELYRRAGWTEVGITKGQTCKRVGGKGTDSWSGRRVWDTVNLRPKRVFCKWVS